MNVVRGNDLDLWVKRVTFCGKNKYNECAWYVEGASRRALWPERVWSGQVRDEKG